MTPSVMAPTWRVDLPLAAVVCVWSLNCVILKGVLLRFDPLVLAAPRFVCAGVLLELLPRWRNRLDRGARADCRAVLGSPLKGFTLHSGRS